MEAKTKITDMLIPDIPNFDVTRLDKATSEGSVSYPHSPAMGVDEENQKVG